MRVALVSLHSSPLELPATRHAGGMNVVVGSLAAALSRAGHEVTLIVSTESVARAALTAPDGVAVHAIRTVSDWASPDHQDAVDDLRALLLTHDVVHAHYWVSAAACARALGDLATRPRGPALVVSLHTIGVQKLGFDPASELGERMRTERELAQSVPLIASSHAEAAALVAGYDATPNGVTVIPPGVDSEAFSFGSSKRANRLLVIGRVQPYKGQDFALEVFARLVTLSLKSEALANLTLSIVGTPTPGAEAFAGGLHAQADELGISNRVAFLGAQTRDEVADLLADSTVTLIPSRSETFGLVALESAAAGTPVVAQRVGGLTESVADGVSGVLLDSRDASVWAQELLDLLADPERLAALRTTARDFALRHSWRQAAERSVSAYHDAIARLR